MSDTFIGVRWAAGDFDLQVELALEGRWTAIFGASGSGKTTLLECVAGLRRPAQGRITLNGRAVFDGAAGLDVPTRERRVGYVSQTLDLFPHLSVRGNLMFGADGASPAEVARVLELEPLMDRMPQHLSGGEKQRVALGRALLRRPDLLLLDEPMSALDAPLRHRVLAYVKRVKREFATPCLYVTHNAEEVLALADAVIVLDRGRVVASGAPSAVLSSPASAVGGVENVLELVVLDSDADQGITRLRLCGETSLVVPYQDVAAGEWLRVGIRAEDVMLARGEAPEVSARNVLAVRIVELVERGHDVFARLRIGEDVFLWTALTPAAVHRLGLTVAMDVFALIKSHSVTVL